MVFICNVVFVLVRGVGIVMFLIVLFFVVVFFGWLFGDGNLMLVVYVSGIFGVFFGVDIMNWKKLKYFDVFMVSIGGVGIFDGVFLVGVIVVFLV